MNTTIELTRTQIKLLADLVHGRKSLKGLDLDFEFIKVLLQINPKLIAKLEYNLLTIELFDFFFGEPFYSRRQDEIQSNLEIYYSSDDRLPATKVKVTRNNLSYRTQYQRFLAIPKKMYKTFHFLVTQAISTGNFHLLNRYKLAKSDFTYELYLLAVSIDAYCLKYVPKQYYTRELIRACYQSYLTSTLEFCFYKLNDHLNQNLLSIQELEEIINKNVRNIAFIEEKYFREQYIELYIENYILHELNRQQEDKRILFNYNRDENIIYINFSGESLFL